MRLLLQRLLLSSLLMEAACSGGGIGSDAGAAVSGARSAESAAIDDSGENAAIDDPAEATNRKIFGANMALDHAVIKPVATAYEDHVPDGIRHGVHNFATNFGEPKVLINDVLQGNLTRAANTTGRFLLNSTIGVAGVFDVAGDIGLPHHDADFGQTFGVWGIAPGPAVQLPLLGSSNVRDSVGTIVGFAADPFTYIPGGAMTAVTVAGTGGGVVGGRAEVLGVTNDLEKNSLDYYATLRSINAQRRAKLVDAGRAGLVDAEPDGAMLSAKPGE